MASFTIELDGKNVHWTAPDNDMLRAALKGLTGYKRFSKSLRNGRKNPEVIVDVGACTGSFSWMLHRTWPDAKIYALEPVRESYACLRENIARIPQIKALRVGASDHSGEMTIAMPTVEQKQRSNPGDGGNIGLMSVYGESEYHKQKIEVHKLDDMFGFADVIKVDAEGHDYQVLLGAERLLAKSRPLLILETLPSNFVLSGNTLEDLLELLARHNYQVMLAFLGNIVCLPIERLPDEAKKVDVKFEPDVHGNYKISWERR